MTDDVRANTNGLSMKKSSADGTSKSSGLKSLFLFFSIKYNFEFFLYCE